MHPIKAHLSISWQEHIEDLYLDTIYIGCSVTKCILGKMLKIWNEWLGSDCAIVCVARAITFTVKAIINRMDKISHGLSRYTRREGVWFVHANFHPGVINRTKLSNVRVIASVIE